VVRAQADAGIKKDRRLGKALRNGKPGAWTEFYDLYAEPLHRFVLARVNGNQELAADVAHDAIVLAVEGIRRFDVRKGSLWSWLCGIAMNTIREAGRDAARAARLRERIQDTASARSEPLIVEDESPDVEVVLSSLNPRHQEVLVRKYVKGLSVKQIAAETGVSEKAVESRLTRARAAFRREYDRLAEAEEVMQDG